MTTTRGGKRDGAGRKRGLASIKAEEARKYVVQRVADELESILTAQIDMAKGIYHEVQNGQENIRVYQRLPDSKVAEYLINQAIGKPKEFTELKVEERHEVDPATKAKINRILGIGQ